MRLTHFPFSALFCCALLLTVATIQAQERISVMSYNVLNFPIGDTPDRDDTLGVLIDYVEPDLLLLQELKTNGGLQSVVDQCNAMLDDVYESGTWVLQISNPAGTWKLQQNLVFNTAKFSLAEQNTIVTPIRDINEFKLLILDEDAQTTPNYLYVFVTHLKSSQGAENEVSRNESAMVFADYLAELPSDAMVLLGGDFNLYTSTEEAYQTLLSSSNAIQMVDPIDSPGNWHSSSFSQKEILTQSTRTSQLLGDGAGGGMDDRFDFVLASENLMTGNSSLMYVANTYEALGNTGNCYNQNITDCDQDPTVPLNILSALYYMSDHLPVLLELESSVPFSVNETSSEQAVFMLAEQRLISKNNTPLSVSAYGMDGRLYGVIASDGVLDLSEWLNSGLYILRIETKGTTTAIQRVFIP